MTSFSVDSVLAFPISEFTSATVKSEGSATVLTLKGISEELFVEGVLELTEDLFESADEYEAVLACLICDNENYTETYKLDADDKVTEFTLSYTYTEKWDEETEVEFFYEEINTVTDAVEAITLPEDVDSYINADEMQ